MVLLGVVPERVTDRLGQGYAVRYGLPPALSSQVIYHRFGVLAGSDEKQQNRNEVMKSPLQLLLIVGAVVTASLSCTN